MRRRAQTNKNNKITKLLAKLQVAVCLVLFFCPIAANGNSIDQKIQETKEVLSGLDSQKKTLNNEVASLDNQIYLAQLKIDSTQKELSVTESQIEITKQEIAQAEDRLNKLKVIMNEYLRTIYVEGQVSTIELIARSKNFSDFVDQSEYLGVMQQNVQETAENIFSLKSTLDQKEKVLQASHAKTKTLLNQQVSERQFIDSQRAAKDSLLYQTSGEEGKYQIILKGLYEARRIASIQTGQLIGGSGSTGGYPWVSGGVDPWAFYKLQCTSYASWYWNEVLKKPWTNTRPGSGNAYQWLNLAMDQNYSVSSTPRVGAIAVWPYASLSRPAGYYYPSDPGYNDVYGHVAIVTDVSGDTISVAEYNFINEEAYSTRANVKTHFSNGYGQLYNLSFIY